MTKMKISIRVSSENNFNIDFEDKLDDDLVITCHNKGDRVYKNSKSKVKKSNIIFHDIINFYNKFEEEKLLLKIEPILKYIENKKIQGDRELWVSYIIEQDQFGFRLSPKLMSFLINHNCSFSLSGIYFDDEDKVKTLHNMV